MGARSVQVKAIGRGARRAKRAAESWQNAEGGAMTKFNRSGFLKNIDETAKRRQRIEAIYSLAERIFIERCDITSDSCIYPELAECAFCAAEWFVKEAEKQLTLDATAKTKKE